MERVRIDLRICTRVGSAITRAIDPWSDRLAALANCKGKGAQKAIRVDADIIEMRKLIAEEDDKEEKHACHEYDVGPDVHNDLTVGSKIGVVDVCPVFARLAAEGNRS
jgi:hypothetical protein